MLIDELRNYITPIPSVEWTHRTSPYVPSGRVFVLRIDGKFGGSTPYLIVSREPLSEDLQLVAMAKYFEAQEESVAKHKG